MVEGQGLRYEPEVLLAFADSTSRLTALATEARTGLRTGLDLPAGVFGEVGGTSGFVAAFADCTERLLAGVDAAAGAIDGLATVVRDYCREGTLLDEQATRELRRAEGA